jgi:hypothetical protein
METSASTFLSQVSPKVPAQTADLKPPHPRRFDRATYNRISGLDARLLELIDYDCRQQAKKSPTGARYSIKPEAWFAKCLSVSRVTISHRICHLEDLGILDVTRRASVRGQWQTNLYKFVSFIWWRLRQTLKGLRRLSHRVKQPLHISVPMKGEETRKEEKGGPTAIKGTLTGLLALVMAGEKLDL